MAQMQCYIVKMCTTRSAFIVTKFSFTVKSLSFERKNLVQLHSGLSRNRQNYIDNMTKSRPHRTRRERKEIIRKDREEWEEDECRNIGQSAQTSRTNPKIGSTCKEPINHFYTLFFHQLLFNRLTKTCNVDCQHKAVCGDSMHALRNNSSLSTLLEEAGG